MTDSVTIPLFSHGEIVAHALVDAADAHRVNELRWGYYGRYAQRGGGVLLHRFILGLERGDSRHVDHINLDRLDNRRENLRLVTQAQNSQNCAGRTATSSAHRGVSYLWGAQRWRAQVRLQGLLYNLGDYDDELEAARAASAFRAEHMPYSADARAKAAS